MRFDRKQIGPLLRQFPERPGAYRVLATNLIPLAGVLLLGWSAGVATLSFFADAVFTAAALTFVLTIHAMDETSPHIRGVSRWCGILMIFVFIVPFIALPAIVAGMFALPFAGVSMLEGWQLLLQDRTVQIGFAGLAAMHVVTAAQWLARHDRRAVRDELREGFGLMVFKVLVLAILGAHVGFVFSLLGAFGQALALLVIAAILTIAEVYRAEVLQAMGVDRKFHESCESGSIEPQPAVQPKARRRRRA
jgi:hypothetical protein